MKDLARSGSGNVVLARMLTKRVAEISQLAMKPNTIDAYGSDWAMWTAFAKHMDIPHFPAAAEHVAAFVAACADGLIFNKTAMGEVVTDGGFDPERKRKYFTLKRYVTAISSIHRQAEKPFDRGNRMLKDVLLGLRKQKPRKQRRVKPLTADLVLHVVAAMPSDTAALRDRAMLLLGVATGMRRAELVGLSFNKLGNGYGVMSIDADGVLIELYESKTGTGEIDAIFVPNGVAADAIREWVRTVRLSDGEPVFMRVYSGGNVVRKRLNQQSVAIIVKRRLAAAGVDPKGFSGHSLRAGLVTSARMAGIANWDIQQVTRHSSASTLDVYTRPIGIRKNGLATRIGLADS